MEKEHLEIDELGDSDIESATIETGIDLGIDQPVTAVGMVIHSRDNTRAVYPLGYIGV